MLALIGLQNVELISGFHSTIIHKRADVCGCRPVLGWLLLFHSRRLRAVLLPSPGLRQCPQPAGCISDYTLRSVPQLCAHCACIVHTRWCTGLVRCTPGAFFPCDGRAGTPDRCLGSMAGREFHCTISIT